MVMAMVMAMVTLFASQTLAFYMEFPRRRYNIKNMNIHQPTITIAIAITITIAKITCRVITFISLFLDEIS